MKHPLRRSVLLDFAIQLFTEHGFSHAPVESVFLLQVTSPKAAQM